MSYHSLSERDSQEYRNLEPHALVDNGIRWHVRAYSEDTYDFRDFVLSRFTQAECLLDLAESSVQYDDDWVEMVNLQLAPHPKLDAQKRENLLLDYGSGASHSEIIEVNVRRALVGYLLQRLGVDTSKDRSMNPNTHQLMLLNRDEIEPFAGWALQ